MLFNSLPFLIFLPLVLGLYWACGRAAQNRLLVAASYLFYGWWDWRFLGLIVLSSAVDFLVGLRLDQATRPAHRRAWLAASLVANLGVLASFKYLDFFLESATELLLLMGFEPHLPTLRLALPVGISFYTFQTLSYTIDIYRGTLRPTRSATSFFAFVAFFPQLVAGPIERAAHLLPQFERARTFDPALAACGARRMLYGLFLKVVVADNLAGIVDAAYADPSQSSPGALLQATYLFAFQIYGDFAGYSHIAIGCALLFGIRLRRNFAMPYLATSPAEFWRRWHISLSTWFRDYVYIPLGGNRGSAARRRSNLLLTFALSGLWHGAGLQFVVWGLLHGLLVAAQPWRDPFDPQHPARGRWAWLRVLATFHLVCLGWVFFRAASLTDALTILGRWRAPASSAAPPLWAWAELSLILIVLLVEWLQRTREHPLDVARWPRRGRWLAYLLVSLAIITLGRTDVVPFIYFQF